MDSVVLIILPEYRCSMDFVVLLFMEVCGKKTIKVLNQNLRFYQEPIRKAAGNDWVDAHVPESVILPLIFLLSSLVEPTPTQRMREYFFRPQPADVPDMTEPCTWDNVSCIVR